MSSIKLSPNASGTGEFTISAPNSNTNRTLTLPDSTGTIATAESTLSQFNASGSAPVYAARAWVNFNGTGVVAIRASGNVTSITDNGTGDYTVNFTTALPDANYAAVMTGGEGSAGSGGRTPASAGQTTTTLRMQVRNMDNGTNDADVVNVAVFR